jgi:hypothetical protein
VNCCFEDSIKIVEKTFTPNFAEAAHEKVERA